MNDFTKKSMAEGYMPDNPPPGCQWNNGWRRFEYTKEVLESIVWESPCGLLRKGHWDDSDNGTWIKEYSAENGVVRDGCPYLGLVECPHLSGKLLGWNCEFHPCDREYDYEQSIERIEAMWDAARHEAWQRDCLPHMCACMEWHPEELRYKPKFDIYKCIQAKCKNEVCAITKRERNLEPVNIFYDILRVKTTKQGFVELTDKSLEKDVKVFKSPVARTDAELWLKRNKGGITRPKENRSDRSDLYFAEHHKFNTVGYEFFNFEMTVQNVRIERRASRDILQDLQDIKEGLRVEHASDNAKAAAAAKKERREAYKNAKQLRLKRKSIERCKRMIETGLNSEGEPAGDVLLDWAAKKLQKEGVAITKQIGFDL